MRRGIWFLYLRVIHYKLIVLTIFLYEDWYNNIISNGEFNNDIFSLKLSSNAGVDYHCISFIVLTWIKALLYIFNIFGFLMCTLQFIILQACSCCFVCFDDVIIICHLHPFIRSKVDWTPLGIKILRQIPVDQRHHRGYSNDCTCSILNGLKHICDFLQTRWLFILSELQWYYLQCTCIHDCDEMGWRT